MAMRSNEPRIVVAGAGVAALEFVLALLEIVAPENEFIYPPLALAETFGATRPFRLGADRIASEVGAR